MIACADSITVDDLASYDPELYKGLVQLKNYAGNVEKDLSLNFTVSEEGGSAATCFCANAA